MPNGHVHYEACDILHWRFTEQTYPTIVIDRFDYSRGLRLVQLRGVRGYAPEPDMRTWKYWHYPNRNARRVRGHERETDHFAVRWKRPAK